MHVALPHRPGVGTACTVRRASSRDDWVEATALLHDYVEWIRAAAGFEPLVVQPELASELADPEAHYSATNALLFLARIGDLAVGTIAVRFHPDRTAELKRMYVRPIGRSSGVADALVVTVLAEAVRSDRRLVWLETKRGAMDRAIAVYRRHGFVETAGSRRTLDIDGLVVMEREPAQRGQPGTAPSRREAGGGRRRC